MRSHSALQESRFQSVFFETAPFKRDVSVEMRFSNRELPDRAFQTTLSKVRFFKFHLGSEAVGLTGLFVF
jgi:hypothetical protein